MVQDEAGTRRVAGTHAGQLRECYGGVEMRADLVVGGRFPDLELPDHRGEPVKLGKLANGFPLIVSFYRGYW